MNVPFKFEDVAMRPADGYVSPEKLSMLKRVFDVVCDEAQIPADRIEMRDTIAQRIMMSADKTDSEAMLIAFAMQAVKDFRR
jgi:hypothetical protein